MSVALAPLKSARHRNRLRRALTETGSALLGVVILISSLAPVYNMFLIALDPEEGGIEFDGNLWPPEPSLEGFREVITQEARYLETFWHQFGNSFFIGLLTMTLTVLIGSLASFAASRMRLSKGSLLTNAALLTYAIPASFLIVPYFRIMHSYGLSDAESARGISPRAAHRSGLDTLASSGSCHRVKAAAFRCMSGSSRCRLTRPNVGDSTGITPASSLLRSSPPLSGASVLSALRL